MLGSTKPHPGKASPGGKKADVSVTTSTGVPATTTVRTANGGAPGRANGVAKVMSSQPVSYSIPPTINNVGVANTKVANATAVNIMATTVANVMATTAGPLTQTDTRQEIVENYLNSLQPMGKTPGLDNR